VSHFFENDNDQRSAIRTIIVTMPGARKIVFVGNSGTGKTSLHLRISTGHYTQTVDSTHVPAFSTHQVSLSTGEVVDLNLWDTAGQEQYSRLTRIFLRDSAVALICHSPETPDADAFDQKAALEAWTASVTRWLNNLNESATGFQVLLVTTKWDLLEEGGPDRKAWEQHGNSLVAQFGFAGHYFTSATTGYGVDDLTTATAELAARIELPESGDVAIGGTGNGGEGDQKKGECC
jgi:small GTP-binding protein